MGRRPGWKPWTGEAQRLREEKHRPSKSRAARGSFERPTGASGASRSRAARFEALGRAAESWSASHSSPEASRALRRDAEFSGGARSLGEARGILRRSVEIRSGCRKPPPPGATFRRLVEVQGEPRDLETARTIFLHIAENTTSRGRFPRAPAKLQTARRRFRDLRESSLTFGRISRTAGTFAEPPRRSATRGKVPYGSGRYTEASQSSPADRQTPRRAVMLSAPDDARRGVCRFIRRCSDSPGWNPGRLAAGSTPRPALTPPFR